MIIFGIFLQFIGFLLCFTIIGAVLGIPLIFIGGFMVLFGFFGRRKTIIQNVVTVQNTAPTAPVRPSQPADTGAAYPKVEDLGAPSVALGAPPLDGRVTTRTPSSETDI